MTDTTTGTESRAVTHTVSLDHGDLHLVDHAGDAPPLVLMHGFPDDSRIYERLIPHLAPNRVVTFDFVGYGSSSRPGRATLERDHHVEELTAALDALNLERATVVAHDASGPVAIDFALAHPRRVQRLVLLNTYYGRAAALRFPEMIRLLAEPDLRPLTDALIGDADHRLWLLGYTAQRLGIDPIDPTGVGAISVVPQFFGGTANADALVAIRAWTAGLLPALDRQDATIAGGRLRDLDMPVTVAFGTRDDYLNAEVAAHIAGLFADAQLHLLDQAAHWPQWDQPGQIADLIHRTEERRS